VLGAAPPPHGGGLTATAPWAWLDQREQLQRLAGAAHAQLVVPAAAAGACRPGGAAGSAGEELRSGACGPTAAAPEVAEAEADADADADALRAAAAAGRRRAQLGAYEARQGQEALRLEAAWARAVRRLALAKARQRAAAAAATASVAGGSQEEEEAGATEEIWVPGDDFGDPSAAVQAGEGRGSVIGSAAGTPASLRTARRGKGRLRKGGARGGGGGGARAAALAAIEAAARRRAAAAAAEWDEEQSAASEGGEDAGAAAEGGEQQGEGPGQCSTASAAAEPGGGSTRSAAAGSGAGAATASPTSAAAAVAARRPLGVCLELEHGSGSVLLTLQLGAEEATAPDQSGGLDAGGASAMEVDGGAAGSLAAANPGAAAATQEAEAAAQAPLSAEAAAAPPRVLALPPVQELPPLSHAGSPRAAGAHPAVAAARALAEAAHALSDFDLLTAPRDLAAPVSGPCRYAAQTAAAAGPWPRAGRNMALAAAAASRDWTLRRLLATAAAPPAGAGARWAPPAGRWLARLAVRGEDGSCLEAALEDADLDAGGGQYGPEPGAVYTDAGRAGGAAAGAAAAILSRLLAPATPGGGGTVAAPPAAGHPEACGEPGALALHRLSRALMAAAPAGAAQGGAVAAARAAALGAILLAEARREAEQGAAAHGVRVRRSAAFDHHLRRRLGGLLADTPLVDALQRAARYGV
jgi:hypothetical protein